MKAKVHTLNTGMHNPYEAAAAYRRTGSHNGVKVLNQHRLAVLDGQTGGHPYRVTGYGRVLTDLEQMVEEYSELMAPKERRIRLEMELERLQAELAKREASEARSA